MGLWALGELEEVERALRPLVEVHRELGLLSAYPLFLLAGALADRGALAEARRDASTLIDSARDRGVLLDEGLGRWALASVLLREGRSAEAEPEILRAREILCTTPAHEPGVLATQAAVLLARGRVDEALAAAREGLARYQSVRAASFLRGAAVRLVHAECLHAAGRGPEAREALAAARDRLLAMAATLGDPERRRSFLERVPENARTLALAQEWLGAAPADAGR
jgi:tetratricopeptide (TPR) repeat protein